MLGSSGVRPSGICYLVTRDVSPDGSPRIQLLSRIYLANMRLCLLGVGRKECNKELRAFLNFKGL